MMPDGSYLRLEPSRVIDLHARGIEEWGGADGPPRPSCVEQSLASATTTAMYWAGDDDPDVLREAVTLLCALARSHCFTDGNKRVAWAAMVDMLALSNLKPVINQEEAAQIVMDIVNKKKDENWLIEYLSAGDRLVEASRAGVGPPPSGVGP